MQHKKRSIAIDLNKLSIELRRKATRDDILTAVHTRPKDFPSLVASAKRHKLFDQQEAVNRAWREWADNIIISYRIVITPGNLSTQAKNCPPITVVATPVDSLHPNQRMAFSDFSKAGNKDQARQAVQRYASQAQGCIEQCIAIAATAKLSEISVLEAWRQAGDTALTKLNRTSKKTIKAH